MKILGRTDDGGSIIEFNNQEIELLNRLNDAMEGNNWHPSLPKGMVIRGDLSKAFQAMIRFIEVKYAVNEIKNLTSELEREIGVED